MTTTEPPDPADAPLPAGPGFVIEVRAVADPLARRGEPGREPHYRLRLLLKRVLRDHGFRCVRVGPWPPPDGGPPQ